VGCNVNKRRKGKNKILKEKRAEVVTELRTGRPNELDSLPGSGKRLSSY